MPRCNAKNTRIRQQEAVKRQAQIAATNRALRAERERTERLAQKNPTHDTKSADVDRVKSADVDRVESKPSSDFKKREKKVVPDYSQTQFEFRTDDKSTESLFAVAFQGLDIMFTQYVMYLVYQARSRLVDIIRVKDPSQVSYVDIEFDPMMPFDVKVTDDDKETTFDRKAHELLYGTIAEFGEYKGHWMKNRQNSFSATQNFNKIQCRVFEETKFYLTDISVEKNKVNLVLANRFGQFQLFRTFKGHRFWHKNAFLPSSVFATLTKTRDDGTTTRARDELVDDAPDFVDVPEEHKCDDLEDEDYFVEQMIRTTRR
jgi:hypothetical protein